MVQQKKNRTPAKQRLEVNHKDFHLIRLQRIKTTTNPSPLFMLLNSLATKTLQMSNPTAAITVLKSKRKSYLRSVGYAARIKHPKWC
ncbi:hypothetical protein DVH24_034611 [Malus domestica]|uniref:Uncharacterized protein n=1 Tax=Malus domestica TaxID=3750 RepID=A0A498J2N4_MALDO|nr:hypothetical protein DVH24_034611 [Malus domestica]